MFDEETSAEYPEHEDFLFNKCFPTLEREYGIKTRVLQSDTTYIEQFYRRYQKGKNIGRIQGFPCSIVRGNWCTKLKTRPINAWKRETGKFTEIVGIAAEEPHPRAFSLEVYDFEGEPAVGVFYHGEQVGNIAKKDLPVVLPLMDRYAGLSDFAITGGGDKYGLEIAVYFKKAA